MKRFALLAVAAAFSAPAMASAQTEPTAAPVPAPAATPVEGESDTTGWFRIDTDSLGTQFWVGATHQIGGFALATDIYVVGTEAELDIGPALSFGNLSLTPMVGITFDFGTTNLSTLVAPQLFTILDLDKIYFESWIQGFIKSVFDDAGEDILYTRNFVLYKVSDEVAVGPQAELSYRLNEEAGAFESGLTSLPVGGRINLGYGKNNTLGIFLGYETESADDVDNITGRFTFIRTW